MSIDIMSRRFTQKRQKNEKKKGGYRGSLGGSPMHGAFTSGATQELKQMGGVHSRATKKAIKKALQAQQNAANAASAASKKAANNAAAAKQAANNAADAAKQAANNAARASKKAANNAAAAANAAKQLHARERIMINDLVRTLETRQRSIAPFSPKLTNAQRAQLLQQERNRNMERMVNDLVGK